MKKRSLFAAVAMLIVSAIVLTSATYAWFASSTAATGPSFSAGITQSGGSFTISADGAEYKTALTLADYYVDGDTAGTLKTACSGCRFPAQLTPVSFDIAESNLPNIAGSIEGTTYKTAAVPTSGAYVVYSIFVKADAACTVNVTLSATQSTAPFIWAAITGTDAKVIVNGSDIEGAARSYCPIAVGTAAGKTATDANSNSIIDSTEVSSDVTLGATVTAGNNVGTLTFTDAGIKTINIIEWVEGQDVACKGTVGGSCSIAVDFALAI